MKKLILLLFITIPLSITAQEVNFYNHSLLQTSTKALKEKKFIFIDLYADWCKPCKEMAAQVFTAQKTMEQAINLAPKNEELIAVLNKINKKEL